MNSTLLILRRMRRHEIGRISRLVCMGVSLLLSLVACRVEAFQVYGELTNPPSANEIQLVANAPPWVRPFFPLSQSRKISKAHLAEFVSNGAYVPHLLSSFTNLIYGDLTEGVLVTTGSRILFWEIMGKVLMLRSTTGERGFFVLTNAPEHAGNPTPISAESWLSVKSPWLRYKPLTPPTVQSIS